MRRHSKEYFQRKACWELTGLDGWDHIKELIEVNQDIASIDSLDDAFSARGLLEKKKYSRSLVSRIERLAREYTTIPVTN